MMLEAAELVLSEHPLKTESAMTPADAKSDLNVFMAVWHVPDYGFDGMSVSDCVKTPIDDLVYLYQGE